MLFDHLFVVKLCDMKANVEKLKKLLEQDGNSGSYTKTYFVNRRWFWTKSYTYTERELNKSEIEQLVQSWPAFHPAKEYFWMLLRKTEATEYVTAGGYPTEKFREEVLENVLNRIHNPSSEKYKENLIDLGKKLPRYFDRVGLLYFIGVSLFILMLCILPLTLFPSAGGVVFPFVIGISLSIISSVLGFLSFAVGYLADRSDCDGYRYKLDNSHTINFGLFTPSLSSSQTKMGVVLESGIDNKI